MTKNFARSSLKSLKAEINCTSKYPGIFCDKSFSKYMYLSTGMYIVCGLASGVLIFYHLQAVLMLALISLELVKLY